MADNQITFLNNKYTRWYYKIIENARTRYINTYTESHHIIPLALGGPDIKENLIRLTAREHFVCHLLLTKMTNGYHNRLMQYAVGKFIQVAPGQKRTFTSWEYKKIREMISLARTGTTHTDKAKKKMSMKAIGRIPWNKGKTLGPHSDESNKKRSETLKGRPLSEETKHKISFSKIGKPSGMLGKTHPNKGKSGKKHTNATKEKLSEIKKGVKFSETHLQNLTVANKRNGLNRRGTHQKQITCPHCGKIGGIGGMKRYHLGNCKVLNNEKTK